MPRAPKTLDHLRDWLSTHDRIAHRDDLLRAGFGIALLRSLVRAGEARLIRRVWIALQGAPEDLVTAARAGGRVTCTSLARRRKWWMPDDVGAELHLHLPPGSGSAR